MNSVWTTAAIAGKPADIYQPPSDAAPRFGVLHLHDESAESLRSLSALTALCDEQRVVCICPHAHHSWWVDKLFPAFDPAITPEAHLVRHVLPYIEERWGLPARSVGLQGIGMGGQEALRLAFKRPDLFPVVAAIAPAIDYHELYHRDPVLQQLYDSKEQCRQDTVLLHVHPTHYPTRVFFCVDPDDDMWFRGSDRLHEKLNALGIPHELDLTTRCGGLRLNYVEKMMPRVVRFVVDGLIQESRRLV